MTIALGLVHLAIHAPRPECGKSTIAEYLHNKYGFQRLAFAEPIKKMCAELLKAYGIHPNKIYFYLWTAEGKRTIIPELGVTGRYLQRTLGTEWGRNLVKRTLWTDAVASVIKKSTRCTVTDDLRFLDEVPVFDPVGHYRIKVFRDDAPPLEGNHESDKELPDELFHCIIYNNSTISDLYARVDTFVNLVSKRHCVRQQVIL